MRLPPRIPERAAIALAIVLSLAALALTALAPAFGLDSAPVYQGF